MWTVEYKATERGPWLPTGILENDAHEAWVTWSARVLVRAIDYYAAQAFGGPAALASIAGVTRKC